MQHCIEEFKSRYDIEVKSDRRKALLLKKCREAKHDLSTSYEVVIDLDFLNDDRDYTIELTRAHFENLCEPIFQNCMPPLISVIEDSGLTKDQIDEIVLVGGSTKIEKIQSMISEFFEGKALNKRINPDEAVAYGATVQAGILSGNHAETIPEI